MEEAALQELITKYLNRTASPEEIRQLTAWYRQQSNREAEWMAESVDSKAEQEAELLASILSQLSITEEARPLRIQEQDNRGSKRPWIRFAAVFLIALGLSAGVYYIISGMRSGDGNQSISGIQQGAQPGDIAPGSNGAILTLAGGKKVILDNAANGQITSQDGTSLTKTSDSSLVYAPTSSKSEQAVAYNILETPRGRQFSVQLPDGSKVWLNSGSTLRYPAAFTGKERLVELTGEAYFEVKHNARMPFRVKAGGSIIEDLGTEFNVSAYADEPSLKVSLLQGKVSLQSSSNHGPNSSATELNPGQQGKISKSGEIQVREADVMAAAAWKNGLFDFSTGADGQGGTPLQSIMRQISRWYDVEVVYQNGIPDRNFGGKITRDCNLSEVLKILAYSDIHFKIAGKKIIVLE